jgi:hypothetical protein
MPLQSCIQAGQRSRFPFHKVAGFDALNFDHHWLILTDRCHLSGRRQIASHKRGYGTLLWSNSDLLSMLVENAANDLG